MSQVTQLCLLGFGEVGQTLAEDLASVGDLALRAYDIKFSDPDSVPSRALRTHASVKACDSDEAPAVGWDLVISAVTAAQELSPTRTR